MFEVGDRVRVVFDSLMGGEDGLEDRVGTVIAVFMYDCYSVDLDPVESDDPDVVMTGLAFDGNELEKIND